MLIYQLFISPFALLLIVLGFLKQNNKFNEKEVRWSNSLRGVKTKINKSTLKAQRIVGWFMILFGIVLFGIILFLFPLLDPSLY